jgi:hypothetical protein
MPLASSSTTPVGKCDASMRRTTIMRYTYISFILGVIVIFFVMRMWNIVNIPSFSFDKYLLEIWQSQLPSQQRSNESSSLDDNLLSI